MPPAYPIAETVLPNGLRVVVSEDHTVPVVAVNLWVAVGSRHEAPGRTGFAHLFEHLMFEGSARVASGEHFSALMAAGARCNATTWFDRTNYFETLPSGALDLALWMEADRHGHLLAAVTQENLDNQRDVVKEEKRQRYDNVPYGDALHRIYAAVFPSDHPYHHPTIGSMADLDAATLDDVHDFFTTHYHPGNTVLTLAGDVTVPDGFAAAERYLGALPGRGRPVDVAPHSAVGVTSTDAGLFLPGTGRGAGSTPPLPPLSSPVRDEATADVPAERVYLAFRLPADRGEGYYAAAAALDVLAGLSISRLERRLVRAESRANHVFAACLGLVDGVSVGFVGVEAAEGVDLDLVEDEVLQELERLGREGPTPAEMEAATAQNERSWLSALAALDERADHIGRATTLFGEPDAVNTLLGRLAAVTAQDVARAAATWLAPSARAVVTYRRPRREPPASNSTDEAGA